MNINDKCMAKSETIHFKVRNQLMLMLSCEIKKKKLCLLLLNIIN